MNIKLRISATICLITLIVFHHSLIEAVSNITPRPQKLTAIATADNDLYFDENPPGEIVDVPSMVQSVFFNITRRAFMDYLGKCKGLDECGNITLEQFYGPILRITESQNRFLYIFTLGWVGRNYYYFVMYDKALDIISREPQSVPAQWVELGLLDEPIVSFDDLDQDGQNELVFEERVHNGTTYNAAVYHYFRIGTDLSLNQIFWLETRLQVPDGEIIRTIKKGKPGTLKMEISLHSSNQKNQKLGEALYIQRSKDARYELDSSSSLDSRYEPFLITGADFDE